MNARVVPRLEIVAAVAANGVIGRGGQLPWHLPADLKHFKSLTTGHPVIMGRRTFESIRKPLPNRRNIVVTTTWDAPPSGVEMARSLDDAIALTDAHQGPRFVVGGSVLYEAALERADALELTELDEPVEGDTFFPSFERTLWTVTRDLHHPADDRHRFGFRIRRYERKRA
jgi:dihydrofolate reductase